MVTAVKINEERLLNTLSDLSRFTDTPGNGITRFSYGRQDAKAREYIIRRANEAGCDVFIDALQNIRIALPDNNHEGKRVISGSHIDTVRNGGWLDGIYGVCAALEILETLRESHRSFQNNYEMVIFAEEEGSNFGSTLTGSKFLTGAYDEPALDSLHDDNGKSLREVLDSLTNPPDICIYNTSDKNYSDLEWNSSDIKSMFELHIEQGPVLDHEPASLGIVESIFGIRVIEVTLKGVGNHAGATPMALRSDALCAAAECILKAESIVKGDADHSSVVTVGKLDISPNSSNVIAEKAKFTVEARDKDIDKINFLMNHIISELRSIAKERNVSCDIKELSNSAPVHLSSRLINVIEQTAKSKNLKYILMDSGAVHDAAMIAGSSDTGMIFVPSIDGRSHVPSENTNSRDLLTGAQFLLDTVLVELQ